MAYEFAGFFAAMIAFMILALLAWVVLMVWTLVDMLKARNDATWKILWLLVIVLLPLLGVLFYIFIGREQKIKKRRKR